jgi:uncharacterized membrane protein
VGSDSSSGSFARRLALMLTTLAILLLLNAVWNVVVWPRFYKRVSQDARARDTSGKPTAFLRVHAILVGVSLLLAAVSAVVAVIAIVNG